MEFSALNKSGYPRLKVFWAFLLCPMVPGFIAGIVKTIAAIAHLAMNPRLIGEAGPELMVMPLLAPFLALLVYLVPFLLFASLIAWMKIERIRRNCTMISLAGAGIATLWVAPFIVAVVRDVDGASYPDYALGLTVLFAAAMTTCWLTAYFFLPHTICLDTDVNRG